ncbi:hypothetical protein IWX47DRAFT_885261 [Phyllosticta citricarpa]
MLTLVVCLLHVLELACLLTCNEKTHRPALFAFLTTHHLPTCFSAERWRTTCVCVVSMRLSSAASKWCAPNDDDLTACLPSSSSVDTVEVEAMDVGDVMTMLMLETHTLPLSQPLYLLVSHHVVILLSVRLDLSNHSDSHRSLSLSNPSQAPQLRRRWSCAKEMAA